MRNFIALLFTISVIGFWCYGIATLNETHPGIAGGVTVATFVFGIIIAQSKK